MQTCGTCMVILRLIPCPTLDSSLTTMIVPRAVGVVTNFTSLFTSPEFCDNIHDCRTVPAIIFNCASTMFLCTWVAFHPDVPDDPEEAWWKKLLRRISYLAMAFLAPEYVFWKSFWEWVNCGDDLRRILSE
jgi:hypothetical protein